MRYKNDIILISILLAAGLAAIMILLISKPVGTTVSVRVDGKEIASFSLSENRELFIPGKGGSNHLIIKGGYAYIDDASCPDGLCIGMGKINRAGQSIICLPNKVVVSIETRGHDEKKTIDFITG